MSRTSFARSFLRGLYRIAREISHFIFQVDFQRAWFFTSHNPRCNASSLSLLGLRKTRSFACFPQTHLAHRLRASPNVVHQKTLYDIIFELLGMRHVLWRIRKL